jgi:molybdopterin-binding protein
MARSQTDGRVPKLALEGVAVLRGTMSVLEVEQLYVEPGEVLAVIGPNGAGKSTLLQVAALLLEPFRGEVRFDGATADHDRLGFRRRLAVAMQEAHLVHGSVLDNAALGLQLRSVSRKERQQRAMAWLRRFGVEGLAQRPTTRLSGGEAQRVSLARAFAIEPELLFLDEPFSGLDEATRHELLDDLQKTLSETGVTTVFVTHDRDEALRLADRVAVLIGGRVRQMGSAAEVFGTPADEEVAKFVGVETIVTGRIVSRDEGLATVAIGDQRITALAPIGETDFVRVCIRPEDVTLQAPMGEGSSSSARNVLWGTVTEVRYTGALARVVLDCGFRLVASVTQRSVEEMGLAQGVSVAAAIKATALHLLPAAHHESELE